MFNDAKVVFLQIKHRFLPFFRNYLIILVDEKFLVELDLKFLWMYKHTQITG